VSSHHRSVVMPGDARDVDAVVEGLKEMRQPMGFRVTWVDPERSVIFLRRKFYIVRIASPRISVWLRQVERERMEVTVRSSTFQLWSYGANRRNVVGVLQCIKASQEFGYRPEQRGPQIGPSDAG
jgi:hypothetical protein